MFRTLEEKVASREQSDFRVAVKHEDCDATDYYNCVYLDAGTVHPQNAATAWDVQSQIKTEEGIANNVSVKEEAEYGNVEAHCAGEVDVKTEKVDLGWDCTEHGQDSSSDIDGDKLNDDIETDSEKPRMYKNVQAHTNVSNKTQTSVNQHEFGNSGESFKKCYECTVCLQKKYFSNSYFLEQHMLTHIEKKPYTRMCRICKRTFSQKSHFIEHKLTHIQARPYKCNVCQNNFIKNSHLELHMLKHTGEKPHQCDICEKRFSRRSDLNRHIFKHTGERLYQCAICEKKFAQVNQLNVHKLTHAGEKPLNCNICKKKFARKGYLIKHMLTHIKEEPHT